jgi:hypothetical protein
MVTHLRYGRSRAHTGVRGSIRQDCHQPSPVILIIVPFPGAAVSLRLEPQAAEAPHHLVSYPHEAAPDERGAEAFQCAGRVAGGFGVTLPRAVKLSVRADLRRIAGLRIAGVVEPLAEEVLRLEIGRGLQSRRTA